MTLLEDRPAVHDDQPTAPRLATLQQRSGRCRVSARLARREMRRRPWRTVLAVLLIAVPVAAMACADVAYRSDRLPHDRAFAFGAADARVRFFPAGGAPISRAEIEAQFPADTTSLWIPHLDAPLRSAAGPDELVSANVVVFDAAEPLAIGKVRVFEGRQPASADEVLLDPALAADFGVGVGDTLSLVRPAQTFTVVGLGDVRVGWSIRYPVLLAPGFDLSVIRPQAISNEILLEGPAFVVPPGGFGVNEGQGLPQIVYSSGPGSGERYGASAYIEVPQPATSNDLDLLLGWIFGVLLMGVLGIVVAAAFAVSGRRQLVAIGQLSATGADPSLVRRYLALQGTWTGLAGVVTGGVAAVAVVGRFGHVFRNDGRLALFPADWMVIAVSAIAVATVAAIVPTRSLASTSVLTALGGRRPVPPVRRRMLPVGSAALGGGLAVMFLAIAAGRSASNSGGNLAVIAILGAVGAVAMLVGVCCLSPLVVDAVAAVGTRRRGVAMLAARSLGRHRSRSAALLAAIVAVGAVGTAAAAAIEQELANERSWDFMGSAADVLEFSGYVVDSSAGAPVTIDPEEAMPDLRNRVESIVGDVTWASARSVASGQALVATAEVLALMGFTSAEREQIAAHGVFEVVPAPQTYPSFDVSTPPEWGEVEVVVRPGLGFGYGRVMVTPSAATELGLASDVAALFGRAAGDLDSSDVASIYRAVPRDEGEFAVFAEFVPAQRIVNVYMPCCVFGMGTTWLRLGTIAGVLALVALIVALGMALWAAEGRDERDTLMVIGASPSDLASIAAMKAWLLTFVGGLLAVILGFGTLRMALKAAHEPTMFPTLYSVVLVGAFPIVVGIVTWLASAAGQRLRPVTASAMIGE